MLKFKSKTSFLSNFINKPIGVTIIKKIRLIIIGDTIFPNIIPNLNQAKLRGDKIFEFIKPKTKKIIENIKKIKFKLSSFNNGYNDKIKNNIPNTIPKLLFELILISFI